MAVGAVITVDLPAPLSDQPADELASRSRLLLVIDEVVRDVSRAGAARALEMALDEIFIEAGRHGLDAIDYEPEDFTRELDAIRRDVN